jgi:hypothetical protein
LVGNEVILVCGYVFEGHIPEFKGESEKWHENTIKRGKTDLVPVTPYNTLLLGKLTVGQLAKGTHYRVQKNLPLVYNLKPTPTVRAFPSYL